MASSPKEEERQLPSSCLGPKRAAGGDGRVLEEDMSSSLTSSPIGGGSRLLPLTSDSIASSKAAACKPLPPTPQGTHFVPSSSPAEVTLHQSSVHPPQGQARLSSSLSHQTRLDSSNSPSKPGSRQVSEDPFSDILKRVAPPSLVLSSQHSSSIEIQQPSFSPPADPCQSLPSQDSATSHPHSIDKPGSTTHSPPTVTHLYRQSGSSLKSLPGPRISLTEEEASSYQTACSSPCSPSKFPQTSDTRFHDNKLDEKRELESSPVFFSDADFELLAAPSSSSGSLPSASPQHSIGGGTSTRVGGSGQEHKTSHDPLTSSPSFRSPNNDNTNSTNLLDDLEFFISSVTNASSSSPPTQTTPALHRQHGSSSPALQNTCDHGNKNSPSSNTHGTSTGHPFDVSPLHQALVIQDAQKERREQGRQGGSGGPSSPLGNKERDFLSGAKEEEGTAERKREGAAFDSWDVFDCQLRGWDDVQREAKRETAQVDERQLEDAGKKTIWVVHQGVCTPVSWYEDTSAEDVKTAVLCACDVMLDDDTGEDSAVAGEDPRTSSTHQKRRGGLCTTTTSFALRQIEPLPKTADVDCDSLFLDICILQLRGGPISPPEGLITSRDCLLPPSPPSDASRSPATPSSASSSTVGSQERRGRTEAGDNPSNFTRESQGLESKYPEGNHHRGNGEGGSRLRVMKGRRVRFEEFGQLMDGCTYMLEKYEENEDEDHTMNTSPLRNKIQSLTGDRWRRLVVPVHPLLHIESQKAFQRMMQGTNLLKHTRYGYPHLRQFQLSMDRRRLLWYTSSKSKSSSVVHLPLLQGLLLGQKSQTFQSYRLPALQHLSFSLVFYTSAAAVVPPSPAGGGGGASSSSRPEGDEDEDEEEDEEGREGEGGGEEIIEEDREERRIRKLIELSKPPSHGVRTLDLTCKDEFEYDMWVTGLKAIIAANKGVRISKKLLLSHSRRFRRALIQNNVAIKLTALPEVKEPGQVNLDDCMDLPWHPPDALQEKYQGLQKRIQAAAAEIRQFDLYRQAPEMLDATSPTTPSNFYSMTGSGPAYAGVYETGGGGSSVLRRGVGSNEGGEAEGDNSNDDETMEHKRMLELSHRVFSLLSSARTALSTFKSEVCQQQASGGSEGRENPAGMSDSSHLNSKDKRDNSEGGAPSNSSRSESRGEEQQPQQEEEDEGEEEEAVVVSISSSGEVKKKRSKRRTGGNGDEGERGSRRGDNSAARDGGDENTDGDENLSFEEKYRKYSHRPSATEAVQAVQQQVKGSVMSLLQQAMPLTQEAQKLFEQAVAVATAAVAGSDDEDDPTTAASTTSASSSGKHSNKKPNQDQWTPEEIERLKQINQLLWKAEVDLENVEDMLARRQQGHLELARGLVASVSDLNQKLSDEVCRWGSQLSSFMSGFVTRLNTLPSTLSADDQQPQSFFNRASSSSSLSVSSSSHNNATNEAAQQGEGGQSKNISTNRKPKLRPSPPPLPSPPLF
ncbi:chromosome condensation regulator related [Cystoisospora suis]|uniref:Chromosome condensation regulator related n=1 Tax=Cystoisospora suis TaxID=483139 RepID=A0A2C6L7X0_9APIC|nr:chromosome condensation regulator related [Cystoisospora suis]